MSKIQDDLEARFNAGTMDDIDLCVWWSTAPDENIEKALETVRQLRTELTEATTCPDCKSYPEETRVCEHCGARWSPIPAPKQPRHAPQ
jgi:hypothetical protein